MIAVRETLCGFGNSDGAKRRAGYHFSAVHAAKAKQLHAIAEGRRRKVACGTSLHHACRMRRGRGRLLRSRGSRVERQ
ncbi:MAG: hypothetical protein DMG37_12405 [Acidobacteria bacterium]|nr:MAG: hypothetical protein DMG37_12405 [Acidobacteriota bacterium]